MAKDRFNKFKPINWDTNWKTTGNKGNRYNTLERKDAYDAYKANEELKESIRIKKLAFEPPQAKPKKEIRTPEMTNVLIAIYDEYKEHMNEWEQNFYQSIISLPFKLSDKQKEIARNIIKKVESLKKNNLNTQAI